MRSIALCFMLLIVGTTGLFSQISPGDLIEGHKQLEGMGNCTQCHTIGKALSNDNCLKCHSELKSRVDAHKGFHASVKGKECVECHKDHHGRTFRIIKFEPEKFDHKQTGYTLEGKHTALKCVQCHVKEKIAAKDVQSLSDARKSRTYLGLGTQCLSCHKDEHRGQFKQECTTCHSMNAWKPAQKFDHSTARFHLDGAHGKVECAKCHKKELENGTVTRFTGMEFDGCQDCHTDPHKGKFKQQCAQCHAVESWHQVKTSVFDHNTTQFPLKGKHGDLKCEQCHPKNPKERNPSGDLGFHIVRYTECMDCHQDAHAKQFSGRKDKGACIACHTEQGFKGTIFSAADHNASRFALVGAHRAVPCVKCHVDGKVNAKSTKQFHWNEKLVCTTCHEDVHKGQFAGKMTNGCETCHSTDAWDVLSFSHDKTSFPLKGKHQSVACEKCHKPKNGVPQYSGLAKMCASCHEDNHAAQFASEKGTTCEKCHREEGWSSLLFDHSSQSRFSLTGKHEQVKCAKCHKEAVIGGKRTIRYKPLESACIDCHPAQ